MHHTGVIPAYRRKEGLRKEEEHKNNIEVLSKSLIEKSGGRKQPIKREKPLGVIFDFSNSQRTKTEKN